MKNLFPLIWIFLVMIVGSCETDEKDRLTKAQSCLDTATPETAESCLTALGNIASAQAYALRCAARFIANGITEEKLVEAMEAQSASSGGSNPVLGMIGVLSFKGADKVEARERSSIAMDECQKSGLGAYSLFASMAEMATVLSTSGGGAALTALQNGEEPTQEQMEESLSGLCGWSTPPTPEEQAAGCNTAAAAPEDVSAIGSVALVANDTYCGASAAENDFCDDLTEVLANATDPNDTEELGKLLLEKFGSSGN